MDGLTGDLIGLYLFTGNALKAFLNQIHTGLLLILANPFAKCVIGAKARTLLIHSYKTEGAAIKNMKTANLKQGFITVSVTFLYHAHTYDNTDGSIGATVLPIFITFGKQWLEDSLINL